jgi:hypothetical protein
MADAMARPMRGNGGLLSARALVDRLRRYSELAVVCRVVELASLAGAILLFLYCLRLAWDAASFPLELEVREGTVWLHVLAKKAEIDIYDPAQVTFVNMNHGPLDSILKSWIATAAPFLPPSFVVRSLVLALPFILLGVAYVLCRKCWAAALTAASALYLFLVLLTPMIFVGRSDATALCGLAVLGALTVRSREAEEVDGSGRWRIGRWTTVGCVAGAVLLTSWRFVPSVLPLMLVGAILPDGNCPTIKKRIRHAVAAVGAELGGAVLIFGAVFFGELKGNWRLYYERFFGFFTSASGWGVFPGARFRAFPAEVISGRRALALGALVLFAIGLYRLRRQRIRACWWVLTLAGSWMAYAFAYYKNQGGGGLQYFCPFFVSIWLFILMTLPRDREPRGLRTAMGLALLSAAVPWKSLASIRGELARERPAAQAFLLELSRRTGLRPATSEDLQLFKRHYSGDIVDAGDTAEAIARTKYFGPDFTKTYQRYREALWNNPPEYVVTAVFDEGTLRGTTSSELQALLLGRYSIVLRGPRTMLASPGATVLLLERKPPEGQASSTAN